MPGHFSSLLSRLSTQKYHDLCHWEGSRENGMFHSTYNGIQISQLRYASGSRRTSSRQSELYRSLPLLVWPSKRFLVVGDIPTNRQGPPAHIWSISDGASFILSDDLKRIWAFLFLAFSPLRHPAFLRRNNGFSLSSFPGNYFLNRETPGK